MTFPQEGVLFSPQPTVAFVEVFIKPEVFLDETRLRSLRESITAVPTKENPPYTPGCNESILSFAGRLSENLNPNDFALVFAISTEKVSDVIPGSPPEGMTNFQERRSDDGKHHFPKSGGDIFFHIKSGPHAEAQDSIDKMIDHIKNKLAGFVQKEIYVRKAFNGASGRNQFGFIDGGSNPKTTANPVLPVGPYNEAYDNVINVKDALKEVDESIAKDFSKEEIEASLKKKQESEKKDEGKLVDLGSYHTSFIDDGKHAGGSFIIWQEWHHYGLDEFNKMDVVDQGKVFGRDKKTGAFLPVAKQGNNPLAGSINKTYPNSHIVRTHIRMTNIHEETADVNPLIQNNPGASTAPLQITRQGSPFYDKELGIKGLGFLAYAKDTLRFDQILDRMIGTNVTWPKKGDTSTDSLLNFSKPVTGAYFYVPNMLELKAMSEEEVSYDVAIIGGGASGLFTGYRLMHHNPSLKIAVIESSSHVGGRLVSIPAPETGDRIITEFGGMRFPSSFPYTNKIVKEMELDKIDFPVDSDINPFYVRGRNGMVRKLKNPKGAKHIFNMSKISNRDIKNGLFIPLLTHLGWHDNPPTNELERKNLRNYLASVRLDKNGKLNRSSDAGELLNEMSIHQLWLKVYGLEAWEYQKTISGYFSTWGDWNAVDAIVDNLSDFGRDVKYFRLKEGYQSLVLKMKEKFCEMGGEVFLGKKLASFSRSGSNAFYLDFGDGSPLVARDLVLAMPRKCLSSIKSDLLAVPQVQRMIQSVSPQPYFKLFMCYEEAWWNRAGKSLQGRSITDLPIRQCYCWEVDEETKHAVVMFYDDGSNPEFWSGILNRGRDPDVQDTWVDNEVAVNVKHEAHRQFTTLLNVDPDKVPKPYAASCANWSSETKFGGGVNFWLPKVDSQEIIKEIIQPIPETRLFICGSAYSNYQGWVEGALESADCMLHEKFHLERFVSPLDRLNIQAINGGKKAIKLHFDLKIKFGEGSSWESIHQSEQKQIEKYGSWDGIGAILGTHAGRSSSNNNHDVDWSNIVIKLNVHLVKLDKFRKRKSITTEHETTIQDLVDTVENEGEFVFKITPKISINFIYN